MPVSLAGRAPEVPAASLVASLVPPPRFDSARFETYVPDPAQPSQAEAVRVLREFAGQIGPSPRRRLFGRPRAPEGPSGVYLDGGYGVGKTHLLASLWHEAPEPKAYGTFVELTNLVGALGFGSAVEALSGHRLLAVDEFELDDPGDTVLVSTFLTRLSDAGVRLAATSNTLPEALGEGRFAAQDFLREIQGLAARFRAQRIDGEDYRHRGLPAAPPPASDDDVRRRAETEPGASYDDFGALLAHLSSLHPSRYGALVDDVSLVCLRGVQPVSDQNAALRLVVLADRLYDRDVPVVASGVPLEALFPDELLRGGYRKKYLRAVSRLTALARQAAPV
ncbi:MAG: cell division protein ZapE [Actinomycetota bacterium]|nr:cell division protein ZapE [Actinomycetota bacterium]